MRKAFSTFLLFFLLSYCYSQTATVVTGGMGSGTGGSISYTFGQVLFNTFSSSSGSISQGVQQPYEISVLTGLKEPSGLGQFIIVYPNPTRHSLILKIEDNILDGIYYKLFDISGKLLETNTVSNLETTIKVEYLSPALYIIKVFRNNKVIASFRIVKN